VTFGRGKLESHWRDNRIKDTIMGPARVFRILKSAFFERGMKTEVYIHRGE